ncbi:MAG: tetratricopeptide repeat protein [Acidobacteriota bacterium]
MQAFPQDPKVPNCYSWIGTCRFEQKQYQQALQDFQSVVDQYPDSNKALPARLKIGLTRLTMGDTAQGVVALKSLIKDAPDSHEAGIAKDRLSKLDAP